MAVHESGRVQVATSLYCHYLSKYNREEKRTTEEDGCFEPYAVSLEIENFAGTLRYDGAVIELHA